MAGAIVEHHRCVQHDRGRVEAAFERGGVEEWLEAGTRLAGRLDHINFPPVFRIGVIHIPHVREYFPRIEIDGEKCNILCTEAIEDILPVKRYRFLCDFLHLPVERRLYAQATPLKKTLLRGSCEELLHLIPHPEHKMRRTDVLA